MDLESTFGVKTTWDATSTSTPTPTTTPIPNKTERVAESKTFEDPFTADGI